MPVRTICVRVAEITDGGTKAEFYDDLRKSLDTSRRAANRSLSLCIAADSELWVGGKCPKLYTYPIVSKDFPGACTVAASICRSVESKYRKERWKIGIGQQSAADYRSFPLPLLCNKSSKMLAVEDCGEFLTARIRLLGGWWTVRIAGGSNYRDQIAGIRRVLQCGKIGDSKIWVDRKHRATIGVSCDFPKSDSRKSTGTLRVCTSRDSLLVMTSPRSDIPHVITGDEARQWIAERERKYRRLWQDRKSGGQRRRIGEKIESAGRKFADRMDSYTHEISKRVVEHATRRKFASIELDMTIKSFAKRFPWFQLADRIRYKCEDAGIEFTDKTQAVAEPSLDKPHVYFVLNPLTMRVKIGKTGSANGGRKANLETGSGVELIVLAIDCQPKSKLTAKEKHYHALFSPNRLHGEHFAAEPVIEWLREVDWLGNAGNLSQIAQYVDVLEDTSASGHLKAHRESRYSECTAGPLAEGGKESGIFASVATAPEVVVQTGGC